MLYWRRKLGIGYTPRPGRETVDWLAVCVDEEPVQAAPDVVCGVVLRVGGARIEVEPGFDPTVLRAVMSALGVAGC